MTYEHREHAMYEERLKLVLSQKTKDMASKSWLYKFDSKKW